MTTTAEATSETFTQMLPNLGKKLVYVTGTPVNDTDFITVTGLATAEGFYLQMDDGSALLTATAIVANKITLSNGSSVTPVTGRVWGY